MYLCGVNISCSVVAKQWDSVLLINRLVAFGNVCCPTSIVQIASGWLHQQEIWERDYAAAMWLLQYCFYQLYYCFSPSFIRADFLKSQGKSKLIHSCHAAAISNLKRWHQRLRMIVAAYLSAIMTNGTIVVKIYLTLIFQGISRNENARHHWNTLFSYSTVFMPVHPRFKPKMAAAW